MDNLLQGLEPSLVWEIFEDISRIPRCSKNEEKIQEYLRKWAEEHNIFYKKDRIGNVLLTRKAAVGYENSPSLMLQAHQDMVCEKTPESRHNFKVDPIPIIVESGKVTANNTSLGADNGMGMALAMAILIDEKLVDNGKIEVYKTIDGELFEDEELAIKHERSVKKLIDRETKFKLNIDKIKAFHKPTLIIHAEFDHIIPFSDGEALYHASPSPDKAFLKIPGANHNDIFMRGPQEYLSAVKNMVDRVIKK